MTNTTQSRSLAGSALCGLLALLIAAPPAAFAQGPPPPPGYQDPALVPPPGYSSQDAQQDAADQAREQDRAYAASAEQWAQANCVRQEEGRSTAGAIIGGILGAVIGSNAASGGGRTGGAIIGGALGAAAGSAIARDSGPLCPQGFVVRSGAPPFAPPPVVVYAAPAWYNPWIWYDGRWLYRPYPYHRYWRDHPGPDPRRR
jgi:hypothetical protein